MQPEQIVYSSLYVLLCVRSKLIAKDMLRSRGAKNPYGLVILSFIAFISLGMPDGLHGVAWPGIRETFGLSVDAIGLVLVFATTGYMIASFFNSQLVRKLGVGKLLAISCFATGGTLLVYANTPIWPLFVLVAFVGGLGAGAIDAGLNTYIAQNHSESVMQWLHAFFGIGITLGPIIMTMGLRFLNSWRPGYLAVGIAQICLAIVFFITRRTWPESSQQAMDDQVPEASIRETFGQFGAILSMIMFLVYTGVELSLGLWSYSLLTESRAVAPTIAGFITGSYWAMFTLGRMLGGLYTRKLSVSTVILISIVIALLGSTLILLNIGGWLTVAGIAIVGFAIAPIFPGMVSDTINRVGKRHESNTIGMQIACAGFGASIMPSLAGVLARYFTLEVIPLFISINLIILLLCFLLSHARSKKRQEQQ